MPPPLEGVADSALALQRDLIVKHFIEQIVEKLEIRIRSLTRIPLYPTRLTGFSATMFPWSATRGSTPSLPSHPRPQAQIPHAWNCLVPANICQHLDSQIFLPTFKTELLHQCRQHSGPFRTWVECCLFGNYPRLMA